MTKICEIHSLKNRNEGSLSILKSIYLLRVECWQDNGLITSHMYPDGWFDELDNSAIHYFITVDNQVVSAARVNILNSINEIPISRVFKGYGYDDAKTIGYISRNVVHPKYRQMGFSKILDTLRLNYLKSNDVKFCFADANQRRMETLRSYNFQSIGKINKDAIENYNKDPDTYVMVKKIC